MNVVVIRPDTAPVSLNIFERIEVAFIGAIAITAHGLRATASTFLNESGLWNPDAIERALAHGDSNVVRGIYHRGKHWDERVRMAQWWSDYLDELRTGGKVIMGKFAKG